MQGGVARGSVPRRGKPRLKFDTSALSNRRRGGCGAPARPTGCGWAIGAS